MILKIFGVAVLLCSSICIRTESNEFPDAEFELSGVLTTGLTYIARHEPESKTASIVFEVHAGHRSNPADASGLAHLIEHLVFEGQSSEHAPSLLMDFIKDHSVSWNGRTTFSSTRFELEVPPDQTAKALATLLRAIKHPALSTEDIIRELRIIDDEFYDALNRDSYRFELLEKSVFGQGHSFSDRAIGSRKTLSTPDILLLAKEFHERHYNFQNMTLGLVSPQSIDEIHEAIYGLEESFPAELATDATDTGSRPVHRQCSSLGANKLVLFNDPKGSHGEAVTRLYFSEADGIAQDAFEYLAFILDFKGAGSLHEYLVKAGRAYFVDAWISRSDPFCNALEITIGLPSEKRTEENSRFIIGALRKWINVVAIAAEDDWRLLEWKLKQSQASMLNPISSNALARELVAQARVMSNAEKRSHQPTEIGSPNKSQIAKAASFLALKNSYSFWPVSVEPEQAVRQEELTGIRYIVLSGLPDTTENPSDETSLNLKPPNENPYLKMQLQPLAKGRSNGETRKLEVVSPSPDALVYGLHAATGLKAYLEFHLRSSFCNAAIECALSARVIESLFSRDARIKFAHAYKAGYEIDISTAGSTLIVELFGPHNGLDILVSEIVGELGMLDPVELDLAEGKRRVKDRLDSFRAADPINQVDYAVTVEAVFPNWHVHDFESALEGFDRDEMVRSINSFNAGLNVAGVFIGDRNHLAEIGEQLEKLTGDNPAKRMAYDNCSPIISWDKETTVAFPIREENSPNAAMTLLTSRIPSVSDEANLRLLQKIIDPPFFQHFRDSETEAYWVGTRAESYGPYVGIVFRAQSAQSSSRQLRDEIQIFIQKISSIIAATGDETFRRAQSSLVNELKVDSMEPQVAFDALRRNLRRGRAYIYRSRDVALIAGLIDRERLQHFVLDLVNDGVQFSVIGSNNRTMTIEDIAPKETARRAGDACVGTS